MIQGCQFIIILIVYINILIICGNCGHYTMVVKPALVTTSVINNNLYYVTLIFIHITFHILYETSV
jgi:hypothetical protein